MSEPTTIHLIRHGTTLLNRANRYRGRRDVPLDAGGWQDAWSAAAELEHAGLTAIYASPCRRARDTARVVADAPGLTEVIDLPGLLNLDYGQWEGLTAEEAAQLHPEEYAAYQQHLPDAACPGGERLDVAARRMVLAVQTLALLHPSETVAAVSHAAMLRLLIAEVSGAPRSEWRHNLPNGSVSTFSIGRDGALKLLNMPVAA
jgi:broad specificity phosphatase PhoE